ncbi:hypothetical protein A3K86_07185 [Photobacterium jeanii]|uniref:Uncharacterized protein n=1 Tax=Photobacterium jeanii TaxID=858640 RepID=A0A178KQ33_9GAMM|nr:DUF2057 domain-containing protein [Photobacterium jeanii]OAN18662.1 hypothetical protein A3K86_07185 [Photobacterium jeanii]PST91658.1 DUF2057 domain-containing protein [Photobacterium jeanii]
MKKTLLASVLPVLLVAQSAWADVKIKVPSNFEILATQQVKLKKAQKEVVLPEGEQHLLVRFDSPTNPHSTAQSLGYVSSQPILVSFYAIDGDVITLKPPRVDTQREVKAFAQKPTFTLIDAKGNPVEHESELVPFEGSPITANYHTLLAAQIGSSVAAPELSATAAGDNGKAVISSASAINVSKLTPAQADALLRELYRGADEQRRKEFMRWALGL